MPYEGECGGVYNACLTKVSVCVWGGGVYNACPTKVSMCVFVGVGVYTMHALRR